MQPDNHLHRHDGMAFSSPNRSRSPSVASETPSAGPMPPLLTPIANPSPAPAYIAPAVASQIVTNNCEAQSELWLDEEGTSSSGQTAIVDGPSLKLINSFLDQLLYNFLHAARSTSLAALRPAVAEILRPTLAREAIAGADQELHQFLGGSDDEELEVFHASQENTGNWNLDLVWKRTRLRCMVYSSLGDVEEEAEEQYLEQTQLNDPPGISDQVNHASITVSPAVAIFLTSVLEFIGEQILAIAGQAAFYRHRSKRPERAESRSSGEGEDRIVVEELDTEKVALNATLGRLWRAWRKRLRSPFANSSRTLSRESMYRPASASGRTSIDPYRRRAHSHDPLGRVSLAGVSVEDIAANIPLPLTANDIDEIEIPGLFELSEQDVIAIRERLRSAETRPRSLVVWTDEDRKRVTFKDEVPNGTSSELEEIENPPEERPVPQRKRSCSLPTAESAPFVYSEEAGEEFFDFVTPPESATIPTDSAIAARAGPGAEKGRYDDEGEFDEDGELGEKEDAEGEDYDFELTQTDELERLAQHTDHPKRTDSRNHPPIEEEPQILETRRVSLEGAVRAGTPSRVSVDSPRQPGTPDSPQGRSRATSGARSIIFADQHLQDQSIDEEPGYSREDPSTIGLARTSDISVHSPPTGTSSLYSDDGRYDENGSRRTSHRSGNSRHFENADLIARNQKNIPKSRIDPARMQDGDYQAVEKEAPSADSTPASYRSTNEFGPSPIQYRSVVNGTSAKGRISPRDRTATSPNKGDIPRSHPTSLSQDNTSPSPIQVPKHASGRSDRSKRQLPALDTEPSQEPRAAVQRIYSPPITPRDGAVSVSKTRRSDSFGRGGQRPIHTSGSGHSQVSQKIKGIMTRQSEDGGGPKSPTSAGRTSETGHQTSPSESNRPLKAAGKEQSFDELIQSDETIQYTLTPRNMRDMENGETVVKKSSHRTQTSELADFFKNTSPPGMRSASASKASPTSRIAPTGRRESHAGQRSVDKINGGPSVLTKPKPVTSNSTNSVPPAIKPNQVRAKGPVARDARVDKESTKDIAEFLRSTGPNGTASEAAAPPTGSSSGPSPRNNAPNLPRHLREQAAGGGAAPRSSSPLTRSQSAASPSGKPRMRLEARNPTVRRADSNSELIEFLREGPPEDAPESQHVKPIASGAVKTGTGPSLRQSNMPTNSTDSVRNGSYRSQEPSVVSSHNSQSALLGANKVLSDDAPPIKRKQRRVRDPYAIDSSDDEDLDLNTDPTPSSNAGIMAGNKKMQQPPQKRPQRQEESLIDFLSSAPPPPDSEVKPFNTAATRSAAANKQQQKPQQQQSAPSSPSLKGPGASIMSRFSRSGIAKPGNKSSAQNTTTSNLSSGPPQVSLEPHSPMFSEDTAITPTTNGRTESPAGAAGKRRLVAGESRSARTDGGSSSELAAFLKNSGPGPASEAPTVPYGPQSSSRSQSPQQGGLASPGARDANEGGLARMFRRKKVAA